MSTKKVGRTAEVLGHLPFLVRTIWRIAPVEMGINLTGALIMGLMPAVQVLYLGKVIDLVGSGQTGAPLVHALLGLAGGLLLQQVGGALWPATNNRLINKLDIGVQEIVLAKAASLSQAQLDSPAVHDQMERASKEQGSRMGRIWLGITRTLFQVGRIGSAAWLLYTQAPWLALLSVLVLGPVGWASTRAADRLGQLFRGQSPMRRRMTYFTNLLTDRAAATEIRSYQLSQFFRGRWQGLFQQERGERRGALRQGLREGLLVADLGTGLFYAIALAVLILRATAGALTAGGAVIALRSVSMLQETLADLASTAGGMIGESIPLADLRAFLSLEGGARPAGAGTPFPSPLQQSIRFEQVSFTYPGQDRPALENLTFELRPGETMALVGINGAGKSTLTKLLLGLYRPTNGRVTIGGVDVSDMEPDSLRRAVSCVFQDFGRFDLTVRENVALGRLTASLEEVRSALAAVGLLSWAESLPDGLDTNLGKAFQGGIDLSGGQWQRLALARAHLHGGELVVLDEPTAALDARAERELFEQFVELVGGRTALLISHRLGSARLADRILVLEGGRLVEAGAHDELMTRGGRYAQLFAAQAQFYAEAQGKVAV